MHQTVERNFTNKRCTVGKISTRENAQRVLSHRGKGGVATVRRGSTLTAVLDSERPPVPSAGGNVGDGPQRAVPSAGGNVGDGPQRAVPSAGGNVGDGPQRAVRWRPLWKTAWHFLSVWHEPAMIQALPS